MYTLFVCFDMPDLATVGAFPLRRSSVACCRIVVVAAVGRHGGRRTTRSHTAGASFVFLPGGSSFVLPFHISNFLLQAKTMLAKSGQIDCMNVTILCFEHPAQDLRSPDLH